MNEAAFIFIPALGALCWGIGGTWHKPTRRFIYPALAALLLGIWGAEWWSALLFGFASAAVFSLGYGDGKSWLWRGVVGSLYGASIIPLGPFGFLAPPFLLLVFTGQMALSRKFNWWQHKAVEVSTGFVHGFMACFVASGGW